MPKYLFWMSVLIILFVGEACQKRAPAQPRRVIPAPTTPLPAATPPPVPVVVETMPMSGDLPVFVLRGATGHEAVGVVLHGYCGHGLGVLQEFQFAAAKAGPFISLQGDRPCGNGALRAWSLDVAATNRRIDAALSSYLGTAPPAEVVLFGSSQGAVLAMGLARRYPEKYRRLILMGVFKADTAPGLGQLDNAHFLVGQYENPWPSRLTAQQLRRVGVKTGLSTVAGAGHSAFRGDGN